jgi:ribosomal protein S18 acetylase RimI-like enzyme
MSSRADCELHQVEFAGSRGTLRLAFHQSPAHMITIVPVTASNVSLFREVRLRALQDSPGAFSSTYAAESKLTEADWIERTRRWNGEQGIGFLAVDEGAGCGIVGCFLEPEPGTRELTQAHLVSMWTAPTHRRQRVGVKLMNAAIDWARSRGATTLRLMVTSNNESAFRFYDRMGLTRTGRTEPYPNDPKVIEHEMSMSLA